MGDEAEITELRLGPPGPAMEGGDGGKCKKRTLVEAVEDESSTTEDGGGGVRGGARGEVPPPAKGRVVGWPPVCSFRQRNAGTAKKVYVKVSMDGAPFLRKVELDACRGYADLTAAVEKLFGIRESSSCMVSPFPATVRRRESWPLPIAFRSWIRTAVITY